PAIAAGDPEAGEGALPRRPGTPPHGLYREGPGGDPGAGAQGTGDLRGLKMAGTVGGKSKLRLCRNCGNVKTRTAIRAKGTYKYQCACDTSRESLALLQKVRTG